MEKQWVCRDYRDGDEAQIVDLFFKVFGRKLSLEFWKWRFRNNPFGNAICKLMFDADKMIGHYAVTPSELQIGDQIVPTAYSMTTMTHPDYKRCGIFTLLAESAYDASMATGKKLVYGFPNLNSYGGFVKKLGWQGFGPMMVWSCRNQVITLPPRHRLSVREIARFDGRIDHLWEREKSGHAVIVPRTKMYLNWRFVDILSVAYRKFLIFPKGEENISGYFILKVFNDGSEEIGHIVDLFYANDRATIAAILDFSIAWFAERNIRKISCWLPNALINADRDLFLKVGFRESESKINFGMRIFKKSDAENLQLASEMGNWHLTMGDSDVF